MATTYFQQNPDVAAAYQQNSYGLTPEQFAQTHYERFGQFEQRAPVGLMSAPVAAPVPAPVAAKPAVVAPAPAPRAVAAKPAVVAPAPVATSVAANAYFQQNPDVAAAFQQNSYGLTPDQFAATHFQKYGVNEQRAAPVQTVAPSEPWDYDQYQRKLRSGEGDFNQEFAKLGGALGQNAQNLYAEILAQQGAGSSEFWYKGNTASKEAAAADFALRLAENGIGSLNQLGQVTVPGVDGPEQQVTINKVTGQLLPRPELLGRGTRGLDIDYNLAFTENGQVIPYTSNRESSWMSFRENALKPAATFALTAFGAPIIGAAVAPGLAAATQGAIGGALVGGGTAALTGGDILKGALLGAGGGYLQGSGALSSGFGPQTDASFLAADAAQLATQGLSESAIAQVLGASGYASGPAASLAASMAVNGLDAATITSQLDALSTNTGLMSQTGSSADFLAADALQLQGQVGNNFAAIEQNLIASGVDPLVAADVSQQIAFNPNLTQTELATNLSNSFGNNIYDVNMATTYPTSVLPDTGGLMSAPAAGVVAGSATGSGATAGATAGTGLTNSQIANLIKAGLGVASAAGAVNAVGSRPTTPLQAPTQGMPAYSPEYYQQLQQYYNAYLPQTPRDVVSPLQQWYNSSYGA